jgi:hypothetical protein
MTVRARSRWLWALAAAGLAARLAFIYATRAEAPHTDFASFLSPSQTLAHPYDTSFREPLFVWWLWFLGKLGITAYPWIRAATALWFLPCLFLAARTADRLTDGKTGLAAAALYAFLPSQIHADGLALRHLMEGAGAAWLVVVLLENPGLSDRKSWGGAAGAAAALALTRINHLFGAGALLALTALRAKSFRPAAAVLPAILALLPHLAHNARAFGDPLYSVNVHSRWFSNLENIGKPGFPATQEEWQKAPYQGGERFADWRFRGRSPFRLLADAALGTFKTLTTFYKTVYFSENLPAAAGWVLFGLYLVGFAAALGAPPGRTVCAALVLFSFPYALVIHVFWAGRFFVPFTPWVLPLVCLGALSLGRGCKTIADRGKRGSAAAR